MFNNTMTSLTVGNQIIQVVSFLVSLYAKFTERCFVMNVKFPFQFILRYPASLTYKAITGAGKSFLLMPIWAIVGFKSPTPIKVTFAANCFAVSSLPFYLTRLRAKAITVSMGKLNLIRLVALLALFLDPFLHMWFFTHQVRSRYALPRFADMYTEAFLRAKVMIYPIFLSGVKAKGSAANLASHLKSFVLCFHPCRQSAFMGAILSRHAEIMAKHLVTSRASGVNFSISICSLAVVFSKAFLGTKPATFFERWSNPKRLSTLLAFYLCPVLKVGSFASGLGSRYSLLYLAPVGIGAFRRAKVMLDYFYLRGRTLKEYAAGFAIQSIHLFCHRVIIA